MHMENPDLVSIKTAVKQMAERISDEADSARQWANLAEARGLAEVSRSLSSVASSLDEAGGETGRAAADIFEAQETHRAHGHHSDG